MSAVKYWGSKISRDFKKLKKEAKVLLDSGKVDKEELIKSIRETRRKLARKSKSYTYHEEVTVKDMIMTLANRAKMNTQSKVQ